MNKSLKIQSEWLAHVRFVSHGKILGIPCRLIQKCLGRRLEDAEVVYFTVRILKNNGLQLCLRPMTYYQAARQQKPRPFKSWYSNGQADRVYISSIGIKRALNVRKETIEERGFPAQITDQEIRIIIPVSNKKQLGIHSHS